MDLIDVVFESVNKTDKVLITFPDIYSFYGISKKISEYYKDILWLLWTDASVERVNHMGQKFGFPTDFDAVIIGSGKSCDFLNEIGRVRISNSLSEELSNFISDDDVAISMGIDFLELYRYDLNYAVRAIIDQERGIMFNCLTYNTQRSEVVDRISAFHDFYIEVKKDDEPAITYHAYKINLRHCLRGGIAYFNDVLPIPDKEIDSYEPF
jgi:hypothetical protein